MKNLLNNSAKNSFEKFNNTLDKKQLNTLFGGTAYSGSASGAGSSGAGNSNSVVTPVIIP